MIIDMLPVLTRLFFLGKLPAEVHLSRLQACILLAVGAQCITMDDLSARLDLPVNQLLAYFNKAVRKMTTSLNKIQVRGVNDVTDAAAILSHTAFVLDLTGIICVS